MFWDTAFTTVLKDYTSVIAPMLAMLSAIGLTWHMFHRQALDQWVTYLGSWLFICAVLVAARPLVTQWAQLLGGN